MQKSALSDAMLTRLAAEKADKYFYEGRTFLAAAAHLSVNDLKLTIQILVRTNELFLAYYLAKNYYPSATEEVAKLLAMRAERYF